MEEKKVKNLVEKIDKMLSKLRTLGVNTECSWDVNNYNAKKKFPSSEIKSQQILKYLAIGKNMWYHSILGEFSMIPNEI